MDKDLEEAIKGLNDSGYEVVSVEPIISAHYGHGFAVPANRNSNEAYGYGYGFSNDFVTILEELLNGSKLVNPEGKVMDIRDLIERASSKV